MIKKSVTWGLLLAWAANDVEEWFTMASWSQRNAGGNAPGPARLKREVSTAHARTAISLMGAVMLAATVDGVRTGGRSRFYQAALAAFGVHGLGHLALSVRQRGYTPGVATSPTVVIPFSLWAWHELGRAGVRRNPSTTLRDAALLLPATLAAVHTGAHLLTAAHTTGSSDRS
ncbi:HXXEE domain-containing protein [Actinocorallia lasiicapitis]